jgi:sugar lactone lactonase YvrE
MKNTFLFQFAIITFLSVQTTIAQSVGIGTDNPNASARLEVNSATQGILIPTLTSAQRSAISNPATGLLIFQIDGTPGFYYYTGGAWVNLTNGRHPNNEGLTVSSNYGLTTTFAGTGSGGSTDGPGTAATFSTPGGVAIDAAGNIYVADRFSHKIRKIIPLADGTCIVSTLAGSGIAANVNGTGAAASFDIPSGVAVDASGNVYVADYLNHSIRKITPAGVVSTLAGSGLTGGADGIGTAASFNRPSGIAIDTSGNLYVADNLNHSIRKITPTGTVSTFAGNGSPGSTDGIGTAASFNQPEAIAIDVSGNMYVADFWNHKIRKITASGIVSTLAGSGSPGSADGIGAAASFTQPAGVATDMSGNIYVADWTNHKIRKITPAGVVSTLAGDGSSGTADGIGAAASFSAPFGIVADASGNIYVSDGTTNKIRKIIAQ